VRARSEAEHSSLVALRPSRAALLVLAAVVSAVGLLAFLVAQPAPAGAAPKKKAKHHFACSGPKSAKEPCLFSTPSHNIRCLWTPGPSNIVCELVATGHGYQLRASGKAKPIQLKLTLGFNNEELPTNQQIVFPESLSCHDTKTTMTCNQDFGTGFFKLARKGSRSG
jgi:hypothetical protein